MPTSLLFLIVIPIIAFLVARRAYPGHLWLIVGFTTGLIIFPFLYATTLPLMYTGKLGHAILQLSNPLTLFHRFPGKAITAILHVSMYPAMRYMLFLIVINGLVWSGIYGFMGWYVDRNPSKNFIHILIMVLAIPIIIPITYILLGTLQLANRSIHSNNYSEICFQVINSEEPETKVWFGLGSFAKGYESVPAVVNRQICRTVDITKAPTQIILGNPQHHEYQKIALDIPVKGGSKSCIGLSPNFKGASGQGTDWTAQVVPCTP